jgi:hypothetical protein
MVDSALMAEAKALELAAQIGQAMAVQHPNFQQIVKSWRRQQQEGIRQGTQGSGQLDQVCISSYQTRKASMLEYSTYKKRAT